MNVFRRPTVLLLAAPVIATVLPLATATPASAETSMSITSVFRGSSNSVTVSGTYACDGEGYPSSVGVSVENTDNDSRVFGATPYAPVCDGSPHSFRVTANKRVSPTPVSFRSGDTAFVTAYLADSRTGYSFVEDSGYYDL
ncbi:DUF6299 family protein [Kitasatospora sp. NPDC004745]|uniref:DUF6299 family protein n=1 Tax=Kitasatospora sp. NPDC004745 TaxID=3364019 RepID=UPI0036CAB3C7